MLCCRTDQPTNHENCPTDASAYSDKHGHQCVLQPGWTAPTCDSNTNCLDSENKMCNTDTDTCVCKSGFNDNENSGTCVEDEGNSIMIKMEFYFSFFSNYEKAKKFEFVASQSLRF